MLFRSVLLALIAWQAWIDPSPAALAATASILPGPASTVIGAHGATLAAAAVGVGLSDLCHIVTDRTVSAFKALL